MRFAILARLSLVIFCLAFAMQAKAQVSGQLRGDMEAFVIRVAQKHGFDEAELRALFMKIELKQDVVKLVTAPATAKPWREFRPPFMSRQRIEGGVKFWTEYEPLLARARETFGVPEELIVSIIGVETVYGRVTGSFRVIDAVATLAFEVPARATFFQNELEEFLVMSRELALNPLNVRGSYAGAMGWVQFIPSSYRKYAVDFDGDGKIDLWSSPADAIGSVANYLKSFGWLPDKTVVVRAKVRDAEKARLLVAEGIKPVIDLQRLADNEIEPEQYMASDDVSALMLFDGADGPEYWLGLGNFYAITRYNRSQNYALAVWQLSQEIADARRRQSAPAQSADKKS